MVESLRRSGRETRTPERYGNDCKIKKWTATRARQDRCRSQTKFVDDKKRLMHGTTRARRDQDRLRAKFIDKSAFMAMWKPAQLPNLGDLTNEVHPIFSRRNFPAGIDYAVLKMSLKLASMFLLSAPVQSLLWTMLKHADVDVEQNGLQEFDDQHNPPEELIAYDDKECEFRVLSGADDLDVNRALHELSKCVTFVAGPDVAYPVTQLNGKIGRPALWNFLRGMKSRIVYSQSAFDLLARETRRQGKSKDVPYLLALRFGMAIELVHEVIHAFQNARDGDLTTEPFLGRNCLVAEMGFALEDRLLGGKFGYLWRSDGPVGPVKRHHKRPGSEAKSRLVGIPVIWEWPCKMTIASYGVDNLGLWCRQNCNDSIRPKDVAWRISIETLAEYMTDAFWASRGATAAYDAVFVPRDIGYAFQADHEGMDADVARLRLAERDVGGKYVPQGYQLRSTGDIVRKTR